MIGVDVKQNTRYGNMEIQAKSNSTFEQSPQKIKPAVKTTISIKDISTTEKHFRFFGKIINIREKEHLNIRDSMCEKLSVTVSDKTGRIDIVVIKPEGRPLKTNETGLFDEENLNKSFSFSNCLCEVFGGKTYLKWGPFAEMKRSKDIKDAFEKQPGRIVKGSIEGARVLKRLMCPECNHEANALEGNKKFAKCTNVGCNRLLKATSCSVVASADITVKASDNEKFSFLVSGKMLSKLTECDHGSTEEELEIALLMVEDNHNFSIDCDGKLM